MLITKKSFVGDKKGKESIQVIGTLKLRSQTYITALVILFTIVRYEIFSDSEQQ